MNLRHIGKGFAVLLTTCLCGCNQQRSAQRPATAPTITSPAATWQVVNVGADGYQISMPGPLVGPIYVGSARKYSVIQANYKLTYSSICAPLPDDITDPAKIRVALAAISNAEVKKLGGDVPEVTREIEFEGKPGIEVQFSGSVRGGGTYVATIQFLIVHSSLYELVVYNSDGNGSNEDRTRFLQSFRLLKSDGTVDTTAAPLYKPVKPIRGRVGNLTFNVPAGWQTAPPAFGPGVIVKSTSTHRLGDRVLPDAFTIREFTGHEASLEQFKSYIEKLSSAQAKQLANHYSRILETKGTGLRFEGTNDVHVSASATTIDGQPAYEFRATSTMIVNGQPIHSQGRSVAVAYKGHLYYVTANCDMKRRLLIGPLADEFIESVHIVP